MTRTIKYDNKLFKFEYDNDQYPIFQGNLLIEFRSFYKFLSYNLYKDIDHKVILNDFIDK